MDIVPLNKACAGSPSCCAIAVLSDDDDDGFDAKVVVVEDIELLLFRCGGTHVKLALLNPPISESHIIFVAPMLSSLSKYMRGNGLVGTCRPFAETLSVHGRSDVESGAMYLHVYSYDGLSFELY